MTPRSLETLYTQKEQSHVLHAAQRANRRRSTPRLNPGAVTSKPRCVYARVRSRFRSRDRKERAFEYE